MHAPGASAADMQIVDNYQPGAASPLYSQEIRDVKWYRALAFTAGSAWVSIDAGAKILVGESKAVNSIPGKTWDRVIFGGLGIWEVGHGNDPIENVGAARGQLPYQTTIIVPFAMDATAGGLPGFQFIQDPIEYETRTHHTNMDVYERIQVADLKQMAAIVASFVYMTANADQLLPRKPLPKR